MLGRLLAGAHTSLLLGLLSLSASPVQAHAPQGRAAALTPDARIAVLALPGFGLLLRREPGEPFVYLCDALLGQPPSDRAPPLAFLTDGSLLLGTARGLRIIAPRRCPGAGSAGELDTAAVVALAVHAGSSEVVYAATEGDKPALWRSSDGGHAWTLRTPLASAERLSALLTSPDDPDTVYFSQGTPQGHSVLQVSRDGGASFVAFAQERDLTLLHVPSGAGRFWALAESADHMTNRGFDLLHAETPSGPWLASLRVNYFGGFTVAPDGTLWVGDEGGGVYRSSDHGDSFSNVAPDVGAACLVHAGDALWACTPGTNQQAALMTWSESTQVFRDVVAFAEVDRLVECGPQVDVPTLCAAGWVEWRRDVLLEDVSRPDGGGATAPAAEDERPDALSDAGRAADAAADAVVSDPARGTGEMGAARRPRPSSGCRVAAAGGALEARPDTPLALLVALSLLALRARRARAHSASVCQDPA